MGGDDEAVAFEGEGLRGRGFGGRGSVSVGMVDFDEFVVLRFGVGCGYGESEDLVGSWVRPAFGWSWPNVFFWFGRRGWFSCVAGDCCVAVPTTLLLSCARSLRIC